MYFQIEWECVGLQIVLKFLVFYVSPKIGHFLGLCNTILGSYRDSLLSSRIALRRDPAFFQYVLFRVDLLHENNHTACSTAYYLSSMSHHKGVINTQACEQLNAHIQRMAPSLQQRGLRSYKFYLAFMMCLRNMEKQRAKSRTVGPVTAVPRTQSALPMSCVDHTPPQQHASGRVSHLLGVCARCSSVHMESTFCRE